MVETGIRWTGGSVLTIRLISLPIHGSNGSQPERGTNVEPSYHMPSFTIPLAHALGSIPSLRMSSSILARPFGLDR